MLSQIKKALKKTADQMKTDDNFITIDSSAFHQPI